MKQLEQLYWIAGWKFEGDLNFCRDCAEKKLAELKMAEPDNTYIIAGGYPSEQDVPPICDTCHIDLDYTPTDYCLREYPESKERA